jgi:hypothetical protein
MVRRSPLVLARRMADPARYEQAEASIVIPGRREAPDLE